MAHVSPESANGSAIAEKADFEPDVLRRSVQVEPPGQGVGYRDGFSGLFFIAQAADEMEPWGRAVKLRDRQLREFIPVEPWFASALGIVAARNAAFSWVLEGPETQTDRMQRVLQTANFGKGWAHLMAQITVDLSTQDSGAFAEIIHEKNTPESPVIGIAHLDALRCHATGVPEEPVIYQDRNGKYHRLKWWQVVHLSELPATHEGIPGLQYCALTRMLRAVRIMRDVGVYLQEKVGGRNNRAVTLVKGVTPTQIAEAWDQAQFRMDAAGLTRFSQPLLVGSIDPKADIGFETLEVASIPDGFSQEEMNKWYIAQMAMAFLTDYQEFAPLPGGNLGTSAQSEVLHLKSQGKGPGLFMKLIAEAINWAVLPEDIEFKWDEPDPEADLQEATTKKMRADGRAVMITSGEITPQVSRMIAYDQGDLTDEMLKELERQDKEAEEQQAEQQNREAQQFDQRFPPQDQQLDDGGTPGSQRSTSNEETLAEGKKDWSEADQIRDDGGRFAGTRGGGR